MLNKAHSLFDVKSIDDERRIIIGMASTPDMDRGGDEMDPKGAQFKLPMPFRWEHKSTVGEVFAATVTPQGIEIHASIPKIDEPGALKDLVDFAWQSIKFKLARGLSIGWSPIEATRNKVGGLSVKKWNWLETSAVSIPMNAQATISLIKSLDPTPVLSGTTLATPVLSGTTRPTAPKDAGRMAKQTIGEQIKSFEATRQAKNARMTELMETAGEKGVTLDDQETEEYDGLELEVKGIDAHLVRLAALEKANKAAAIPVQGDTATHATASRTGVIQVKSAAPKGTAFTRYVMAIAAGRGSRMEAAEYAKRWEGSTPEVAQVLKAAITASTPNLAEMLVKAASAPGSTTDSDWAAPLVVYQNMANEFIELLRAETILDKIVGMRRVPFNISIPRQTQAGTVGWVGQSKPKPVGELKFDQVTLGMAKAAGIIVLNEELVRSSDPSAEALVRADLIATMAEYLDTQLLDPSVAEVSNVSPAAITNGVTPVDSTGTNYAALVADVKTVFAAFTAANIKRAGMVAIMSETQAQALSMMLNALGLRSLPDVNMSGGTLFGIPVITSENVPLDGGSPEGGRIIFVSAPNVLLADDGGVAIDVSREASVQMNTAPDDPQTASTVMVSLWQNNLVGLRAERFINWKKRRDAAVQFINDANYS